MTFAEALQQADYVKVATRWKGKRWSIFATLRKGEAEALQYTHGDPVCGWEITIGEQPTPDGVQDCTVLWIKS